MDSGSSALRRVNVGGYWGGSAGEDCQGIEVGAVGDRQRVTAWR
jgi:hypothetical protein